MAKFKTGNKALELNVKVKLSFRERFDERQLLYFSTKDIKGFLKVKKIKRRSVEYCGMNAIPLSMMLKNTVKKHDFWLMMGQIVDATYEIEKNSLSVNNIIFNIHNIFINKVTKEMQFLYLPIEKKEVRSEILNCILSIIYSMKPEKGEDTSYITKFVYFLKSLENYNKIEIENYIRKEDREAIQTIRYGVQNVSYEERHESIVTDILIEETGILEEETGLLMDEPQVLKKTVSLLRLFNHDTITINKKVFRIGKGKDSIDYTINFNDKISRKHVEIVCRDNGYFILDLNSTNHTYVNGEMLQGEKEVQIFSGDIIKMADEEFEFSV